MANIINCCDAIKRARNCCPYLLCDTDKGMLRGFITIAVLCLVPPVDGSRIEHVAQYKNMPRMVHHE
ncbi:hypothetical protein RvY_16291 [Ramazzottius varieornatus]|uniref:Uncharacterized protein n=1 Tax=Ramazzottius varieornatus TaxID=947166 RepID=A0A1D1W4E9_RAMVA|nr:hypothetical protein RvY_16291 [Ramazzottius varieornatus]